MKPFRSWIQVGLLLAISAWAALNPAYSDDPSLPPDSDRPVAVSPDVESEENSTSAKAAEAKPAKDVLNPEVENSLPTSTVTPPTGESSVPKPQTAVDIDSQFETPIEVNPQSASSSPRGLFSRSEEHTSELQSR